MKKTAVYIVLFITFPLNAQVVLMKDTIKIHEVVISGQQTFAVMPGFKNLRIEKEGISNYGSSTLGEILTVLSPLSVKDYGAGGISTPSFRGTGASHTLILWNGVNINNPMAGLSDLSLIIPGLMDEIVVSPGGSSMSSGSGGFGGSIDLRNTADWNRRTSIIICPGKGSFGNFRGFVSAAISTGSFQSVTKGFFQTADNDFTYLDTYSGSDPVRKTRENGQTDRKGIMQEIYFRKSGNTISARVWYQTSAGILQQPVISQQIIGGEKQSDESMRSMIDYSSGKSRNRFFITAAVMTNRLHYLNTLASIDSRNQTGTILVKGGISLKIREYTTMKIFLNNERNSVRSNNYEKSVSRNNASITMSAERKTGGRFSSSVLLRQIIDDNRLLIPDLSAGLDFRLSSNENYFIYGNFSRNSRIPSMNDLYWLPGGNPGLKNEYAFMYEFGYRMKSEASANVSWSTDVGLFGNSVRDMIYWHPGEYSYWTADNLKSVNTSGVESFAEARFSGNGFNIRVNGGYTYTRAVDADPANEASKGKQLIYIPENQANGVIQIGFGSLYYVWVTDFTGRRYTSSDNSDFLPGYTRNNIVSGIKVKIGQISADISFRIDNLFSVSYESIAYYPQPGRAYFLSIKLKYDK